jgi:uncharacterized cupin superfamily protein
MKHLFKLDNQQSAEVINENLEGWTVVQGTPTMKTWILHTSNDGSMISGVWTATAGTYHATYAEYEFVHIIEGSITITPDGEESMDVGPGDAFVVEAGFTGTWEIKEPVLKHFDIQL